MALVPLRTSADAAGRAAETLAAVEENGPVMPILRAVSNASTAFSAFLRYSAALVYKLELPPRTRELVIMRAAAHWGSRYEWGEHYAFASRAGVTDEELSALAAGELPETLSDHERDVLALVDTVLAGEIVETDSAVRYTLVAALGTQQYTELALAVGWWCGCVPALVGMLGLEEDAPTAVVPL